MLYLSATGGPALKWSLARQISRHRMHGHKIQPWCLCLRGRPRPGSMRSPTRDHRRLILDPGHQSVTHKVTRQGNIVLVVNIRLTVDHFLCRWLPTEEVEPCLNPYNYNGWTSFLHFFWLGIPLSSKRCGHVTVADIWTVTWTYFNREKSWYFLKQLVDESAFYVCVCGRICFLVVVASAVCKSNHQGHHHGWLAGGTA